MGAVAANLSEARNVLHQYPPGPDCSHNLAERAEQGRIRFTGATIALMLAEGATRGTACQDQVSPVANCGDRQELRWVDPSDVPSQKLRRRIIGLVCIPHPRIYVDACHHINSGVQESTGQSTGTAEEVECFQDPRAPSIARAHSSRFRSGRPGVPATRR